MHSVMLKTTGRLHSLLAYLYRRAQREPIGSEQHDRLIRLASVVGIELLLRGRRGSRVR